MQEINDNTILEKQQEDVIRKPKDQEGSIKDNVQVIKNVKEIGRNEEIDEKATFLHEKDLNEDFVKTLSNTDLTDKHISLKTQNLSDDNIENLQNLWQTKNKVNNSSESINSTSGSLSFNDDAQTSSNSIYLKEVLSKPLIQALHEIVVKKPTDPVEYLGHWLLHYKICEEQTMRRKEYELKLLISKEKLEKI
ncbi:uncharacterized protein LOC114254842 isoform X2 [Monomorium pharaonis]|uniref:uncharacterized protein LOC114254842 isoform X2 n=1 Tax=Monomorium pharaonis TaxID=307658 RepID=UPI00174734DB|nr:uncharacterized protein LOC114254842 isoform X2 [Monomorium pharaonis]